MKTVTFNNLKGVEVEYPLSYAKPYSLRWGEAPRIHWNKVLEVTLGVHLMNKTRMKIHTTSHGDDYQEDGDKTENLLIAMCTFIGEDRETRRSNFITYKRKIKHIIKRGTYYPPLYCESKITDDDTHYVYVYKKDGVIKYVGEGSLPTYNGDKPFKPNHNTYRRAMQVLQHAHCTKCIKHHLKISVHIIAHFKSKDESVGYEQKLIRKYKLKKLWNGRL